MNCKAMLILPYHSSDKDLWKRKTWQYSRIPPIGLLSLATYAAKNGYKVEVVDCRQLISANCTNDVLPIIIDMVNRFKPDIIGINVLTALFNESKYIFTELRKRFSDLTMIAGGPHPSIEPELTLDQIPSLDGVCVGEGEKTFLSILNRGIQLDIPGLMVQGSPYKFVPRKVAHDIDCYPYLDYGLVKHNFYTSYSAYTTFGWLTSSLSALTSRSCPFSCKFCASDWSKPYRFHSADYIVELVSRLAKYNIDTIAFWDDTIALPKERLEQICKRFLNSKIFRPFGELRWRASMRADQVDRDSIRMMKSAGCYHIAVGIESGSNAILKRMKKKTTVKQNKRACDVIVEEGIDLGVSYMVGLPSETEEDIKKTFTFIKDLHCNIKGCGSFRPLPGSPFYTEFVKKGMLKREETDWSNLGNFSIISDQVYADIDKRKLEELLSEGQKLAYADQYVSVFKEIYKKNPVLVQDVQKKVDVKIFD